MSDLANILINGGISLLAVIITAITTNRITTYRIEQLERKVEKHNSVIERVYKLEQKVEDIE